MARLIPQSSVRYFFFLSLQTFLRLFRDSLFIMHSVVGYIFSWLIEINSPSNSIYLILIRLFVRENLASCDMSVC